MFEPFSTRVTIQDGVYQRLRHALMRGVFDPGQTLTIAFLAESFGTSHMPVREALRRLAAENALEIASSGSARVPNVTSTRLDDLCYARSIVEGAAVSLGAPNIDSTTIEMLEQNVFEHAVATRAGDVHVMLAKNQDFHFTFYNASRSDVMIQLIETLWLRFGPYLRLLDDQCVIPPRNVAESEEHLRYHRAMLAAVKRREFSEVAKFLVQDISATQMLLHTRCLRDTPDTNGRAGRQLDTRSHV